MTLTRTTVVAAPVVSSCVHSKDSSDRVCGRGVRKPEVKDEGKSYAWADGKMELSCTEMGKLWKKQVFGEGDKEFGVGRGKLEMPVRRLRTAILQAARNSSLSSGARSGLEVSFESSQQGMRLKDTCCLRSLRA